MQPPPSRLISTIYGPVEGLRLVDEGARSVDAFLGLPYAKPPVGELRFRKPQPPTEWTSVLHAKKLPPRCIQEVMPMLPDPEAAKSEDSLYLNVFTPTWQPPEGGFPVMVFVHGGGFVYGDSRTYGDVGICRHLATKDVVVIVIQYGLGYLGFFSTGDSACPGNFGLWDQTEALKWTRDNIAAFGGNPSSAKAQVVLQSNCCYSVRIHKRGSLNMAGAAYCPWVMNSKVAEHCRAYAAELGVTEKDSEKWISIEMLEELRKLPAQLLAAKTGWDYTSGAFVFDTTPVLDCDFLPAPLEELRKKAPRKPLLTGIAKLESNYTLVVMTTQPTVASLRRQIGRILPESLPRKDDVIEKLLHEEYGIDDATIDMAKIKRAYAEALSDEQFNVGFYRILAAFDAAGWEAPIFSYVFEHFNRDAYGQFAKDVEIHEPGHATELPYLFGTCYFNKAPLAGEQNFAMLEQFSTAFTNFAKYGDPSGAASAPLPLSRPPVASSSLETHFVFAREPRVERQLFGGRLARIANYFKD